MQVDPAIAAALDRVAARERDLRNAFEPGAFARAADVRSKTQPRLELDPCSAAAPPDAFFVVQTSDGRRAYTRDGHIALRDGHIIDAAGTPLLGFITAGGVPAVLRVDPVDAALKRVANLRIEADGSVAYDRRAIDPRSGLRISTRVLVGRLALARFPAGTNLRPLDATHGLAPDGVTPLVGRPGDAAFASLLPLHRAQSGIDIDRGLEHLQEAYLALDALHTARTTQYGAEKTAMDLLK